MRSEMRPTLQTGHFHISKIQKAKIQEDLKPQEIKKLLTIVKQTLTEGFKTL